MAPIVGLLAADRVTVRRAWALAALIALQMTTDLVYVAGPLVLVVGIVALVRLSRRSSRTDGLRIVGALALAGVAVAPMAAGYVGVRRANPDLAQQTVWKGMRHLWMDPSTLLPALNAPLSVDLLVFVPIVAGALAIALIGTTPARARAWRHAALWFVVVLAISWVLPVAIPAVRDIYAAARMRDIVRLGFPGLVALCLLVGLGFASVADAVVAYAPSRLARLTPVVLLALWLPTRVAHAPWPPGEVPVGPAPVPGREAAVLARRAGPVLELPIGNPDVDTESHAAAMYRSTAHWRTLVNGYSSYYPHGFRERMELARELPDRRALGLLRDETGLTSIVVHAAGMPQLTIGRWRAAMRRGELPGVRIEYADDDVLVVSVD
jgi:hypothetical protein